VSVSTTARIFHEALGWEPGEGIRGGARIRTPSLAGARDAALAAAAHPEVPRLRQELEARLDALVGEAPADAASLVFDVLRSAIERVEDDVEARRAAAGGRLPFARRRAAAALARAERHDASVQRMFVEALRAVGAHRPGLCAAPGTSSEL
jgi:hypothetical protein